LIADNGAAHAAPLHDHAHLTKKSRIGRQELRTTCLVGSVRSYARATAVRRPVERVFQPTRECDVHRAVGLVLFSLALIATVCVQAHAQDRYRERIIDRDIRVIDEDRFDRDFDRGRYPDRERYRRWIFLGEKIVDFRAERDVIELGYPEDWFRDRAFRTLHFFAERNDVLMHRIRIRYFDDRAQDIEIERPIPEGSDLAIDLGGDRSYIRRIEMFYRSSREGDSRGVIRVYGEPVRFGGPPPEAALPPPEGAGWVELGCRRVSLFRTDRDIIELSRRDGRFRAIRLISREGDIEMLDLRVIYANGEPDNIPVRRLLVSGERTRPLDLRGRERTLDRIEMVYRSLVRPADVAVDDKIGHPIVCVEGLI
jgi:hypothetical protein